MELQETWWEKLDGLTTKECMPLEGTPQQTIYSALRDNKRKLKGRQFRIQTDKKSKAQFVCRLK